MSATRLDPADGRRALVDLFDRALPEVYGYLASRCGSAVDAEDLAAETFLAAADAVRRGTVDDVTTAWLIGIARHKLVDHWRRREREERALSAVAADPTSEPEVDDWDVQLDALVAHEALAALGAHHRAALTLRYVDGLPVADVARCLDRSVGATEVLLVRARRAFRATYEQADDAGEEDR